MSLLKTAGQIWSGLWKLMLLEQKVGWKNIVCLLTLCFIMGLGAGGILHLCLRALQCSHSVSLAISGSFTAVTGAALFLSKYLRCITLIFLISCGTQQGRNGLITAGTSVVLLKCAQNIFTNLQGLAESAVCYLEHMLPSIRGIMEMYREVIKWISEQALKIPKNIFVKLEDKFELNYRVEDEDFERNLSTVKHRLKSLGDNIKSSFDIIFLVWKNTLAIIGVLFILVATWFYIRRYLNKMKFENVFITNQFLKYDAAQKEKGKPHLLSLTQKERKYIIEFPSLWLTAREWKTMARFFTPIFINLCAWATNIMIDWALYIFISSIRNQLEILPEHLALKGEIQNPVKMSAQMFSYETHLYKRECIPRPTLSITEIWIPLVVIIAALMLVTLFSAKLTVLKVLVLASFYPDTESDRVQFLHQKLLQKRMSVNLENREKKLSTQANSVINWLPRFAHKIYSQFTLHYIL
uniref:Dendritic cell-specific transmembrane protein-like domain-containing protein n=1 Tax=Callorhinchus milii TaxID=7868 RepID=A0A4W3HZQ2_CALMI